MESKFNPKQIEEKVLNFWSDRSIYKLSVQKNQKGPLFRFIDGPPYTTGAIHLGTAWNKVMKDTILRYKRLQGYNVRDQPGYDMHGLPIEVKVEEDLKIRTKKEIEERIGVDKFVEHCRKFALDNLWIMNKQFARLGVWMDWENPYMTIKDSYIEGAWWALKEAYGKGALYLGPGSVTWCARCSTALAKHELEYENVKDNSIFVKFALEGKKNEFVIIWTTTPWTLPANMGVAVNPDFMYSKLKVDNEFWYVAKDMAAALLGAMGRKFEIVENISGEKMHGWKYTHPFADEIELQKKLEKENKKAHTVLAVGDDVFPNFVTLQAGSGLVHTAPGAGPEDFIVGKHFGIPAVTLIDETGTFTKDAGKFAGLRAKKDDAKFVEHLKNKGMIVHEAVVEHEYPHCWRCKKPVVYRVTDQWYIGVTKLRSKMISENKKIKWTPDWAGDRWFHSWLENLQDWCISRQRYWGIPLPIWVCQKCKHTKVIGSRQELGSSVKELHRPWIDKVILKCEKCKGEMKRVSDVLDVWLDSGAAPWASLPFPEDGKKVLDRWFPADFILEGKDQIRGWFNSLMSLSMVSHGKPSFKSVYMHGFVSDANGMKMSKSLGNIVSPDQVIEKHGSEAFRLYCIKGEAGEDLRFNWKDVEESYKALNILWNTAVFASYMDLSKFNPETYRLDKKKLNPEDKWILSRINSLNGKLTHAFETYNFHEIQGLLSTFIVEDVSRWYVKLLRNRTWVSVAGEDKLVAFKVLYEVLKRYLILASPVLPLLSEEIYQNLVRPFSNKLPESIHLSEWPKPDTSFVNEKLEEQMEIARKIVETSLTIREEAKVKLRWPLKHLSVEGEKVGAAVKTFEDVILEQANVKTVKAGAGKGNAKEFAYGKAILDTEITQDILGEALAREVMRAIQSLRKKNNFTVDEKITLTLSSSDEFSREALNKFRKEIVEKVGASKIEIHVQAGKEKFTDELDFEGKKVQIAFDRAK